MAISALGLVFTQTSDYTRRLLDTYYRRPALITGFEITPNERPVPRLTDWWDYWRPIRLIGQADLIQATVALRSAWENYIRAGFDESLVQEYCFRYFALLTAVMSARQRAGVSSLMHKAALATVGFECAGIHTRRYDADSLASVTTTARNPVYLLTRLKWPNIPHSTRFLPLVALNDPQPSTFGHYRRYPLSEDGAQSLLIYPRNLLGGDTRSLETIATFANALGASSDPFAPDRARRLWDHVVKPLVEQHRLGASHVAFDFVDIGGGTGALVGALCEHILGWSQQTAVDPRFRLVLVDVCRTGLASSLTTGDLTRHIDGITRETIDYRSWLATLPAAASQRSIRFGLACKVFDMASQFVVRPFTHDELPAPPAEADWFRPETRSPVICLAPGGDGPETLMVSPLRFQVEDGHVFGQPALSDYFRELSFVSSAQQLGQPDSVSLPVRIFNPSALVTSKGGSVLDEMLRRVDYLIIEDADFRPQELLAHFKRFQVSNIVLYDVTSTMRLTGNYAYVLLRRGRPLPRLEGDRLA